MGKLLKDGLILRSLTENPNDKERFAEFMHLAFENNGDWQDSDFTRWINDLLYNHPSMSLEHVWCIVDPANKGKIVSGLFLIPQIWRYEDIEFPVGRPEIVATLPEYRRRGLVRELFHVLHEYSENHGDLLQAITGIPYFYRQFGYGFAVDLGSRGRIPFTSIPKLGDDKKTRFSLREATEMDIPYLIELDKSDIGQVLLSVVRNEALWRYEISERSTKSIWNIDVHMIVDSDNQVLGYVALNESDDNANSRSIWRWVIGKKSNYLETFEDVLRAVKEKCESDSDKILAIDIVDNIHPVIVKLMKRNYGMYTTARSYAWYLRVSDHVAFIKKITPVLERRLSTSILHNYSGKLRIGFYQREDLYIRFNQGKIVDVCMSDAPGYPDTRFPFDTWLNVVFGANSEDEIHHILPETTSTAESAILLEILFPKKHSSIFAIG